MIYKYEILFKKPLNGGGLKVVTYTNLLENPNVFGPGEGYADAEGELSMVLEGPEAGFSINALMRKYRSRLVGHKNAEMFGKELPLHFVFRKPDDLSSVMVELCDDDGHACSSRTYCETVEGYKTLNLEDLSSFVILIAKEGPCKITDDSGATVCLVPGQALFCAESTGYVTVEAEKSQLIVAGMES